MEKLIDAEVVKEYLKRAIFGADVKIDGWVDAMPAADAVPVTWLRNLCAIAKMETDDEMFIDWLIQTWQEEQEAGQ